jgi:hypothetical protein
MSVVDEYARASRTRAKDEEDGHALAILYGMAENEALGEVCNIVDEVGATVYLVGIGLTTSKLVAAARTLFGSQRFLSNGIRRDHDTESHVI